MTAVPDSVLRKSGFPTGKRANWLFFRNCKLRGRYTNDEIGLLWLALSDLFRSWKSDGGACAQTYVDRYLSGKLMVAFERERPLPLESLAGLMLDLEGPTMLDYGTPVDYGIPGVQCAE